MRGRAGGGPGWFPLALELAAARASLLGPCALRERLHGKLAGLDAATVDTAARHHSLHAAITWSYELLPSLSCQVLRQLAVFRGTIALDAAASVTQLDEDQLLDQLATLIDASLLRSLHDDPPSFRLLETIRAFAAERLGHDGGEMDPRTRHAEFYHALGESAAPHLWDPQQQVWFDRLEREHDNLRAALQFWLSTGKPERARPRARPLAPFWEARGHLEEGLGWLSQALAAAQDAEPGHPRMGDVLCLPAWRICAARQPRRPRSFRRACACSGRAETCAVKSSHSRTWVTPQPCAVRYLRPWTGGRRALNGPVNCAIHGIWPWR